MTKREANTLAAKRYRERNPSAVKEYTKKYREKNREALLVYSKANQQKIGYRFKSSKNLSKKRNIEWTLSLEEYESKLSKDCHYCDGPTGKTGCGLDRVDNTKGYIVNNVVSCCGECNRIKSNTITYEEMVALASLLKEMRKI